MNRKFERKGAAPSTLKRQHPQAHDAFPKL